MQETFEHKLDDVAARLNGMSAGLKPLEERQRILLTSHAVGEVCRSWYGRVKTKGPDDKLVGADIPSTLAAALCSVLAIGQARANTDDDDGAFSGIHAQACGTLRHAHSDVVFSCAQDEARQLM